jgi:hypothetical protein
LAGPEDEVAERVLTDLFDEQCVAQSMEDVLSVDAMSEAPSGEPPRTNRTTKS